MDNAGGPSRSDQLDLMLTYQQQAHARTKAERDNLRNKLTAMTAARHIEEDRANEADGQLVVLNAEMVALHTQLGAEDEESVLDAVLRLQRSREDDTVLLGTVAAERDAALQRAEQAESALAQAQAERDAKQAEQESVTTERNEAVQGLRDCHMLARRALAAATREGMAKHLPHILRICERQAPEGTQMTSILRDEPIAQPPALPPLPEGWVREGVRDIILYRSHDRYTGVDGHVPPGGQVSVHAEGLRVSTTHVPVADLLIVLRHAEAAHLTLKEGK